MSRYKGQGEGNAAQAGQARIGDRSALFYATAFAGPSVAQPCLPPFLAGRGLGPETIGRALAAVAALALAGLPVLARAVTPKGTAP
jgi:hypothetical protein